MLIKGNCWCIWEQNGFFVSVEGLEEGSFQDSFISFPSIRLPRQLKILLEFP